MGLAKLVPGQQDVNDAFSKPNLRRTKREYKTLLETNSYHFGALMPWFCGLDPTQTAMWETEVAAHYPIGIQREVERVVGAALLHKDDNDNEVPVPVKWSWVGPIAGGPAKGIITTYDASDPTAPFYSVQIIGCQAPDASSFFMRPRRGLGRRSSEESE
jgi:hypothetical protein